MLKFTIYPYFIYILECYNIKGSYLFTINLGWIYPKKGYNISRKEGEDFMKFNINNLVSISEANQNFSKVARLVDENGAAVILKNNVPRYVLIEYSQLQKEETIGDEEVDEVAKRVLSKHMKAFEELAKWKD